MPSVYEEGRGMIGVGIVGANPDRGWALRAHVPALAAVDGFALRAVATTREASARAAASRFGAEHWFTDARALAEHPDVHLVVVAVKVPAHAELVHAALDAGKAVLCEWPLGRTTDEAADLERAARTAGVPAVIGLQTRFAPAVARARELVAAGHVGTVTAATLVTTRGKGADGRVPGWSAYTLDAWSGAGTLEVMGGHALDALQHVLGPLDEVSATASVQRPHLTVAETGETVTVTSPDTVALHAELPGGPPVSVQLRDVEAAPPRTRFEIAGHRGGLAVVSRGGRTWEEIQFSVGDLGLEVTTGEGWRTLELPATAREPAEVGGRNLARLYRSLGDDLRTGVITTPRFTDALGVHRLLDAIRRSAQTGARCRPAS